MRFSGLDAHDQVGARTGFYHYCQRIRFGPTVKPLRPRNDNVRFETNVPSRPNFQIARYAKP